jgi:dienelactone hydrolase
MKHPFWFVFFICFLLLSCAGAGRYSPPSGGGPCVLMISGKSGPSLYVEHARRLAASGYTVLLYDGNDFPVNQVQLCQAKIRAVLQDAGFLSAAKPGRAAVIGYSLGGAAALACAAAMEEEIVGVIAYYPATALFKDDEDCVRRIRVPVMVLQGEDDHFLNCCTIGPIRRISDAAAGRGKQVQLIVYPGAGHGFNLGPFKNKGLDDDSWRRTLQALKMYFSQ